MINAGAKPMCTVCGCYADDVKVKDPNGCAHCMCHVHHADGTLRPVAPIPDGRKDDQGKHRWDLLPARAVELVVDVLTFGAKKYAPNNWQVVPGGRDRYFAACQRHLWAWWQGERFDQDSGKHHLAHAACCVLFMLWLDTDQGK